MFSIQILINDGWCFYHYNVCVSVTLSKMMFLSHKGVWIQSFSTFSLFCNAKGTELTVSDTEATLSGIATAKTYPEPTGFLRISVDTLMVKAVCVTEF